MLIVDEVWRQYADMSGIAYCHYKWMFSRWLDVETRIQLAGYVVQLVRSIEIRKEDFPESNRSGTLHSNVNTYLAVIGLMRQTQRIFHEHEDPISSDWFFFENLEDRVLDEILAEGISYIQVVAYMLLEERFLPVGMCAQVNILLTYVCNLQDNMEDSSIVQNANRG